VTNILAYRPTGIHVCMEKQVIADKKAASPQHGRFCGIHQVAPVCSLPNILPASLGPPESTTETASQSIQPFLHSLPQSVVGQGMSFAQKLRLRMGRSEPPSKTWHRDRFSRLCKLTAESRYTLQRQPFPAP